MTDSPATGTDQTLTAGTATAPVIPTASAPIDTAATQTPTPAPGTQTPTPPTPANGTQVLFGVTFNINGQQVPVYAKDITKIARDGIEFTLPQAIDLGTFNDFANWFKTQFGVDIPDTSTLPAPLDNIAGELADLDVSVDALHVKIPPAPAAPAPAPATGGAGPTATRPPTQYTVALRGVFPGDGFDLIPGILTIQGAVFGVSNEKR